MAFLTTDCDVPHEKFSQPRKAKVRKIKLWIVKASILYSARILSKEVLPHHCPRCIWLERQVGTSHRPQKSKVAETPELVRTTRSLISCPYHASL